MAAEGIRTAVNRALGRSSKSTAKASKVSILRLALLFGPRLYNIAHVLQLLPDDTSPLRVLFERTTALEVPFPVWAGEARERLRQLTQE
jgi:hypothetical protein